MKVSNSRARAAALISVSVVVLAVGSVNVVQAVGSAKSGNSSVKACVDGTAKRKCPAGTKSVKLAKRGPAGATGPQGEQGPAGATGPQGPSDVWVDTVEADAPVAIPAAGFVSNIMSIAVPAGTYLIETTATFGVGSESSASLNCSTSYSTGGNGQGLTVAVSSPTLYQSAGWHDVETFASATTVSVYCNTITGNAGGTALLLTGTVSATQIDTNHGSGT